MIRPDFDSMPDEAIVKLAQESDGAALEYLLNKYKNFVRTKARSYFLIGADHGFEVHQIIIDDALDAVDGTENCVDLFGQDALLEYADQTCIDGTSGAAGLCNGDIHVYFLP